MKHLAALFLTAQAADVATTWHSIAAGIASERNPIGVLILQHGLGGLIAAKAIGSAVLLGMVIAIHRSSPDWANKGLRWASSIMLGVVAWNLNVING